MFSIFSIVRSTATIQRQHAREIRRENLRWKLELLFNALIIGGMIYGVYSALSADDAMSVCQRTYSYATCFEALK